MITAETLRALIALVEEAKGPDRRLDYEIFVAFAEPGQSNSWDPHFRHHYTTSIDAALALVAKVLPGATWAIHPGWGDDIPEGEARGYEASVGGSPDCGGPWTRHDTPPLAIITSLLAALLQQSETAHVER